jgi:hypothetical protein
VVDEAGAWCAAFPRDSAGDPASTPDGRIATGTPVTIVLAGATEPWALGATVRTRRRASCPAAFPQPRWDAYAAYDVALVDTLRPQEADVPTVALVVAGDRLRVTRGPQGWMRLDVDGDGVSEELRRCAADEGEHFTLWSRDSASAPWRRQAHEYFDWGVLVERRCRAGEDGRGERSPLARAR